MSDRQMWFLVANFWCGISSLSSGVAAWIALFIGIGSAIAWGALAIGEIIAEAKQ